MKASKTLPIFAILSGVLAVFYWVPNQSDDGFGQTSIETLQNNEHFTESEADALPSVPPSLAKLQSKLAALEATIAQAEDLIAESEMLLDEPESEEAEEVTMIAGWEVQEDSLLLGDPEIPLGDQVKAYEKVSAARPDALPGEGDRVKLSLLDGKTATVDVKRGVFSQNGDYSWSGHLEGYGTDYPVIVTYGDRASFAMITTPEGSYSMESVNGKGWIYKNPSEEELTAPGNQDYLEIPGSQAHQHHDH